MRDETRYDRVGLPTEVLDRIDRACDRFEAAWERGERPRAEDFLGDADAPFRAAMVRDLLAAEVDARRRRGERPEPFEYLDRFPEDTSAVDSAFGQAAGVGGTVAGQAAPDGSCRAGEPTPGTTLSRSNPPSNAREANALGLGGSDGPRFHVLRPHARGGLGAVFVALDREVPREVALKQILDRRADDPVSRSRFLVEAEITGALEHPGIVPVYGQGTGVDGRPYYAMRFIRGDTLRDVVARFHGEDGPGRDPVRRPLEMRKLLRRFLDVCNAIEYAHSRGVLHRDIKPANVVVGRHGETLVVDWGLAKAAGRAWDGTTDTEERPVLPLSAGGVDETLPGVRQGTPAFMSPEQAAGEVERVDHRSDVYGLGVTLYGVLTGEAPFKADTVEDTLRAVLEGRFPPPRAVDPAVDRPLEAVCLKAMAHRREDRYASARALADDVDRWLADEPVEAFREPPAARARRWARRNRTLVASAGVGLTLTLVGLALGVVLLGDAYRRETRYANELVTANLEINRRNAELTAANAAIKKAERLADTRLDRAMTAIQDYFTGVTAEAIRGGKVPAEVRDRLLEKPRQFYQELNKEVGERPDPSLRERYLLCRGEFNLARLLTTLGRVPEARRQYEATIKTHEALLELDPDDDRSRGNLAGVYNNLGTLLRRMGNSEEAARVFREGTRVTETLIARHPDDPKFREGLAVSFVNLGALFVHLGRYGEAIEENGKAIAAFEHLVSVHPEQASYRDKLAISYVNRGGLLQDMKRYDDSVVASRKAVGALAALAEKYPEVPGYRDRLATSQTNLAEALVELGRPGEAADLNRAAVRIREGLVAREPEVPEYRDGLARSRLGLGIALSALNRPGEAAEADRLAITSYRDLVSRHADQPDYLSQLGLSLNQLAHALQALGRHEEAAATYREAVTHQRGLLGRSPKVRTYRVYLGEHYEGLARSLRALRRAGEAVGATREWVKLWPGDPDQLYNAARAFALCLPVEPDPVRRRALADEAVATLRSASAAGWSDALRAAADPDLAPLAGHDGFRRLLGEGLDRDFPSSPFGPSDRGPASMPPAAIDR